MKNIVEVLLALTGTTCVPFGSRTIEGAYTDNSDYDYLSYNPFGSPKNTLLAEGFIREGADVYSAEPFTSYRKEDVNVIVCNDFEFFWKSLQANELCKRLKIKSKGERLMIFDVVQGGELISLWEAANK